MSAWDHEIRQHLRPLRLTPRRENEIVAELSDHLDDRFRELRTEGLPEAEARRRTLDELTGSEALGEALGRGDRDPAPEAPPLGGRSGAGLTASVRDLRFGVRSLRKSPGFAALAIATLALAIGATVTIFTLVNAVVLRPLPLPDGERLIRFWGTAPEKGLPVVDYPAALYEYVRLRTRTLASVSGGTNTTFTLTGDGEPERLRAMNATADLFTTLGVRPLYGRDFRPEEGRVGNNLVTILSHGFWQRRFAGDTAILGRAIDLNGIPTTVVGIMAPEYRFPRHAELWVPIGIDPQSTSCWCYAMLGRLAPGATVGDAAIELARLTDDFFAEREPGVVRTERARVIAVPMVRDLSEPVADPLLLLLGAVALVLLIACANIANLLLARGVLRRQEVAIRCCLGATRRQVLRQLLIESGVIAAGGAIIGVALAVLGVRTLGRVVIERVPHVSRIALDGDALAFAAVVTIVAGLLFGVAPAFRTASVDPGVALRDGGRGSRSARARALNRGFVVAQFALSLVLLVSAALVLESFRNVLATERGFRSDGVLVARLSLPTRAYRDGAAALAFHEQLLERLRVVPGVNDVALTQTAPFSAGGNQNNVYIEGHRPAPGEAVRVASLRSVTPSYFQAIGTAIQRGRPFTDADRGTSPPVAVIDETLARQYWPEGDAVGRRIRIADPTSPPITIVGVAQSVRHGSLIAPADHYVYVPLQQMPRWTVDVVVRTVDRPEAVTAALRREVTAIDPRIPLYDVHTLERALSDSLLPQRILRLMLATFAVAALLLATLGIYGVMALGVGARTNEFGIRIALGARPAQVHRLVFSEGARLVALGIAIGLPGALTLARAMRSLLHGVEPFDPIIFAASAIVLAAAALAACYLPARRATKTDPMLALRAE